MSDAPAGDGHAGGSRPSRLGLRIARAFVDQDSYGLVLLLILLTYVMAVSMDFEWTPTAVVFMQIVTVWLALRTAKSRRPVRIAANAVLVVTGVIALGHLLPEGADASLAAVFIASSLLYFIAPFAIMRHLMTRDVVDRETILGAAAAYLLIGMFFAFVYRFVAAVQPAAFFGPQGDGSIAQTLFFSFTTLTTTGYGNLVPAANPGQTLAVFEMVFGQLFLVTAVAKVVTSWRPQKRTGGGAR